jgi:rhodanese-related sulfurtransferase
MDVSTVSPVELQRELASQTPPVVVDVRTSDAFLRSDTFIAGALRRPDESTPRLAGSLPDRPIVVYCEKGGDVGESAARRLVADGRAARFLLGGVRGWVEGGGVTLPKPVGASTRWVTRERPKIDRIACPWLVKRFIDPDAEFRYVGAAEVGEVARRERAIPFDVPDTLFSHDGERCSFDAFLKVFRIEDPALVVLARIIRGADTGRLDLAPECAGLLAASLGMSRLRSSDHEMLRDGLVLYDALYLWARDAMQETHTWNTPHPKPQNPPRLFDRTSREPFDSGRT